MKLLAVLGLMTSALVACGPSNDDLRATLDRRAEFDMNCPSIRAIPLEATNGYVTSYGVTGCGRRATYVLSPSTYSWIMNVSDTAPVGQYPAKAPTRPPPIVK